METKYNIMFVSYSFFKGKFKGMEVCSSREFVLKIVTASLERYGIAGGQEVVFIKWKIS